MEKVLIITYYWPPAGGPGVQRWLLFVKYLKDYGVEPVVYIPSNPDYPMIDKNFEKDVPKDITILKGKIFEPYAFARLFSTKQTSKISSGIIADEKSQSSIQKMMLYIRGNFFIPDARKYWIKPSVSLLSKYIEENNIKKIITTGPPHSVHLIGLNLKNSHDLKWFADFRDPWTQIGYHKKLKLSNSSKQKHLQLESEVLNKADEVIVTSFTTKVEFKDKTSKPITVITNGFDEHLRNSVILDSKFSISHIGSLLSGRDPQVLWQVIKELIDENKQFAKDLVIRLAGAVSEDVLLSMENFGLKSFIELKGYVSHQKALELQRISQILLLIEIDSVETKGIIPGKLFEYLAAQRPIIAVGPDGWDVKKILKKTNAGKYFNYTDKKELKSSILESYNLYKHDCLNVQTSNIDEYSRYNLTGTLAKLIKAT